MSEYNLFAGVDENYRFPPEVRAALIESLNIRNAGAPMTTSQRNALPTADLDPGYYIFNTDIMGFQVWRPEFIGVAGADVWHDGLENPGSEKWWPSNSIPKGWFKHDNRSLPRADYVALFKVIGTTYGGEDTPTHFRLANTSGRTLIDANGNHLLGTQGGAERVKLTIGEIPQHNHPGSTNELTYTHRHTGYTTSDGAHEHTYMAPKVDNGSVGQSSIYRNREAQWTGGGGGHGHNIMTDYETYVHSHSVSTENRGGDGEHENMMPYHSGHFIIKY